MRIDPNLVIPNRELSLNQGAISVTGWDSRSADSMFHMYLEALAEKYEFSLDAPISQLPQKGLDALLYGTGSEKLTLHYERKGRGGKEATIIVCPDSMSDAQTADLGAALKKAMGTGGSVRGNEILLQGDRREALRKRLAAMGYRVKG